MKTIRHIAIAILMLLSLSSCLAVSPYRHSYYSGSYRSFHHYDHHGGWGHHRY